MDLYGIMRTMGALGIVLGLLAGALWAVRRYNIRLPGATGANPSRRLAVVERVTVDARRSVALVRRDGREHLILFAPEGNLLLESGIEAVPVAVAEVATPAAAPDFAAMVETIAKVRRRAGAKVGTAAASLGKRIETRLKVVEPVALPPAPIARPKRDVSRRPAAPRAVRVRKAAAGA